MRPSPAVVFFAVAGVFLVLTQTTKGKQLMSTTIWKLDPRGNKYDTAFTAAETAHGLPAGLLRRMAYQESRFNPTARSPVGASGLLQFMPATAKAYGIDPLDPFASITAAAKMMQSLHKQFGRWDYALAAYNWGSGNLTKFIAGARTMPAETVAYMAQASDVGVV